MTVRVVTDSVASIPCDEAEALGIEVVSLFLSEGETSVPELDMDVAAFYKRIEDMRVLPTSSQPSVDSLANAFRRQLEHGTEVLGVFISRQMSGTLEAARIAAEMVSGESPGARIELLDSGSNSMEEGFGAIAAARAGAAGETIERCMDIARDTLSRTRYLFTPESLDYLRRGGRIGAASALLGTLLQIRPVLTVENGVTTTFTKARTHTRALAEIVRKFSDDIAAYGLVRVIVHYIGEPEPAQAWATEFIEPLAGGPVRVIPVSPVIGLHVGQAVAIVYETERAWL